MKKTATAKRQQPTTKLIGTLRSLLRSLFNSSDPSRLPDLPLELVAEILCRLPVKLLLQLRCLSKSFNNLISDPNFAKKHLRLSTTSRNLILTYFDDTIDRKPTLVFYRLHSIFHRSRSIFNSVTVKPTQLHYLFDPLYSIIVGSCNGILCLDKNDFEMVEQSDVILWNPSVGKFKILPSFKIQGECGLVKYGFGYDHVKDVYKIVAVFSYYCCNEVFKTQGMVHTLGTNSWRTIQWELPLPCSCESLIYVSGALNWLCKDNRNHSVVFFDLVIESYRRLLLPNYGGEYLDKVNLGVSRGCLCTLHVVPVFLVFG
ncbi:putative F-box domain-containing protein [Medicago truncatula]|uniref:Putative F-box domain-containing protein n=1 Tax=Medicago truncatula TaxID=3880 RepID=A0A396IP57_MEDTR|nr:F-box/kelch-repeat protein At3g23880 [Medicago truncatula]RHN67362.1 putative F-box domain-containing protein [Medicago truncatula]